MAPINYDLPHALYYIIDDERKVARLKRGGKDADHDQYVWTTKLAAEMGKVADQGINGTKISYVASLVQMAALVCDAIESAKRQDLGREPHQ